MISQQRIASVKERKSYFEQLGHFPNGITQRITILGEDHEKPRPLSEASSLTAPQKPKRTFQHEIFLKSHPPTEVPRSVLPEMEQSSSSFVGLSNKIEAQGLKQTHDPANNFDENCTTALSIGCDANYYAVTPVPIRRRHSENDLYAVPITEKERVERNGGTPQHHTSLYYASAELKDDPVEYPHSSTLRRKFAFKKSPKGKSGRAEVSPSKLHSTRPSVDSDLKRRATRAKLVRRGTLAHSDFVDEFCGRPKPQLFEAALLVKIVEKHDGPIISRKPVIEFCYPDNCQSAFANMAELFYPDHTHSSLLAKGDFWAGDEEFMVALTESDGTRRYAYCLKYLPTRKPVKEETENDAGEYPVVLTVITPIRNSMFYMDLVRSSYQYARKGTQLLRDYLHCVFPHNYPSTRGASLFVLEKLPIGVTRRIQIENHGTVMGRTGSAAMISRLTPEVTVCLIAALLGEQRVLIAGNSVGDVEIIHPSCKMPDGEKPITCSTTRIVQMLEALIRPLPWPHTFIPIVPDNLIDLCDNPTPYLMGILRSNLSTVKELIVENKDDPERRQMDFVFVDIDTGLVNPAPFPMSPGMDLDEWRYENAVVFCARLGWPRKLCTGLIRAMRDAIRTQPGPVADGKVENVMLRWYSQLFGHYRLVGAHDNWDQETRRLLVAWQPEKSYRPYLEYLVETALFEEWMKGRMVQAPPVAGSIPEPDRVQNPPLPGSEEELNEKLDKIWTTEFNSLTPRPISKMVTKMTYMLNGFRKTSN